MGKIVGNGGLGGLWNWLVVGVSVCCVVVL